MAFVSIYLSIGSNLGDRKANILRALGMLDDALGCHYVSLSKMIETKPWKMKGGKFLNCAVLYRVYADPEKTPTRSCLDLLDICKDIERKMGRIDKEEYDAVGERIYHSRIIDIDILFYDSETIETESLIVPHKGIAERPFVMIPLMEIAKPSLKAAFPEIFA